MNRKRLQTTINKTNPFWRVACHGVYFVGHLLTIIQPPPERVFCEVMMTRNEEYKKGKEVREKANKLAARLRDEKPVEIQKEVNKRYNVEMGKTRSFSILEQVVADMMDPYQLSIYYWIKSVIAMRPDGKIDMTSRQISRASKMSHQQVSRCIKWLEENRVITIEKISKKKAKHDSYLLTLRDEELAAELDSHLTYSKLRPRNWAKKYDDKVSRSYQDD